MTSVRGVLVVGSGFGVRGMGVVATTAVIRVMVCIVIHLSRCDASGQPESKLSSPSAYRQC